jgi:hypothetical protein
VCNDVIADEHGTGYDAGQFLGKQLGVDVDDLMDFSSAYAIKKLPGRKIPGEDARLSVTMAFAAGVMSTLRAVKLLEQEALEEGRKAA